MQKPGNIAVIPNILYINYSRRAKAENTPNKSSLFLIIFQSQTKHKHVYMTIRSYLYQDKISGFKFNFFDSLLKLASGIIFYLLNLSANLLFHTCKHC